VTLILQDPLLSSSHSLTPPSPVLLRATPLLCKFFICDSRPLSWTSVSSRITAASCGAVHITRLKVWARGHRRGHRQLGAAEHSIFYNQALLPPLLPSHTHTHTAPHRKFCTCFLTRCRNTQPFACIAGRPQPLQGRQGGPRRARCHTSRVTRHASHVMHHTSRVTRHTSCVTCHTSHVTRHTSRVTRHTSHFTSHTSHVTRHKPHMNLTHHASRNALGFHRSCAAQRAQRACKVPLRVFLP
jgi:hypothetical protein